MALKRIRVDQDKEGMPITALREMHLLERLQHRNIIRLKEVVRSKRHVCPRMALGAGTGQRLTACWPAQLSRATRTWAPSIWCSSTWTMISWGSWSGEHPMAKSLTSLMCGLCWSTVTA